MSALIRRQACNPKVRVFRMDTGILFGFKTTKVTVFSLVFHFASNHLEQVLCSVRVVIYDSQVMWSSHVGAFRFVGSEFRVCLMGFVSTTDSEAYH